MNRYVIAAMFALAAATASAQAPAFGLKGYELGAEMTVCPPDVVQQTEEANGSRTCMLPIDSLGSSKASVFMLKIFEARIYMLGVSLNERGIHSHLALRDALTDKFGEPWNARGMRNRFEWRSGSHSLVFDGLEGTVVVLDLSVAQQLRKRRASSLQSDL